MLLAQGVNLVSDLQKNHLAVLSGPADTVMAEALKIPGVESVEEDIILSAHVGRIYCHHLNFQNQDLVSN
jgi:hypothetical protein